MAQRLCLITGGNTGVGYEVAKQLLQKGHQVMIACRDNARAQNAVVRLQQATGSSSVSSVYCDLSSLVSVKAAADQITKQWPKLDVLVCNAAVITQKPVVTADGFNTMYQVNHLSHFLLVHLLLPQLLNSEAGRIVVVGSQQHSTVPAELTDPQLFHKLAAAQQNSAGSSSSNQQQLGIAVPASGAAAAVPTAMQLYSVTKLYNLWFSRHLATQLLPKLDNKVVINTVSPGFVPTTDLGRNVAGPLGQLAMNYIMSWAPFAVTVQEGAGRLVAVCVGDYEGSVTGKYFTKRQQTEPSVTALDDNKAAELWQNSLLDCGIKDYLPHQ